MDKPGNKFYNTTYKSHTQIHIYSKKFILPYQAEEFREKLKIK